MIILGLDPGIARTGYGVIDTSAQSLFHSCGCLTTPAHDSAPDRLSSLADNLDALIKQVKPRRAVVEDIFFGVNAKTAISTAQARGVLLYVLNQHHIPITSFTPLQIKSRLCGYGRATKQQMQDQVKAQLKLDSIPKPDDAADGLAAALCLVDMPENSSIINHSITQNS